MATCPSPAGSIRRISAALAIGVMGSISACDDEFDPIQSTEMAYSIFGYLDPAQDTQWIRITPFRETILSSPDLPDAVVTVEDLGAGRSIQTIPTLYARLAANFNDSLWAYNFRVEEPIAPGGTYRLSARMSDGRMSAATVSIPQDLLDLPVVVRIAQASVRSGDVIRFPVAAGDHIAMVNSWRYAPSALGDPPLPTNMCRDLHLPRTRYNTIPKREITETGYFEMPISMATPSPEREFPPPCEGGEEYAIRIVRTREPWPFGTGPLNLHSGVPTNIENGIGFLGGIITRVVPHDTCELSGPGTPQYCDLYYGPETATLTVTPVNRLPIPDDHFAPVVQLRRVGESWWRRGMRHPLWDPETKITRFPGLLSGSYWVRVGMDPVCDDRLLHIGAGEELSVEAELGPFDPDAEFNADGCEEKSF